jgi:hypothetical protein
MLDLLIGYWPLWLGLVCFAIAAVTVIGACRAAALGDEQLRAARDERRAALAGRPSPAPIDVEPMR